MGFETTQGQANMFGLTLFIMGCSAVSETAVEALSLVAGLIDQRFIGQPSPLRAPVQAETRQQPPAAPVVA